LHQIFNIHQLYIKSCSIIHKIPFEFRENEFEANTITCTERNKREKANIRIRVNPTSTTII